MQAILNRCGIFVEHLRNSQPAKVNREGFLSLQGFRFLLTLHIRIFFFCLTLVRPDLNVPNLLQQIITYQLFHSNHPALTPGDSTQSSSAMETDPIIFSQNIQTSTLPDSMNPSRALSQTDIVEKVHDLSSVPPNVRRHNGSLSTEQERRSALKFISLSYGKVASEETLYPKVSSWN